jgi:hypothetical protein
MEKEFTKSPRFVRVSSQIRDVLYRRGLRTKPPPSLPGPNERRGDTLYAESSAGAETTEE